MPWVIAQLRGQRVYARADSTGQLVAEAGRVEIRYNPRDGRMYRAAARNLEIVEPAALPDTTCGPAEAPEAKPSKTANKSAATPGATSKRGGARKRRGSPGGSGTNSAAIAASARVVAYTDGACSGNPGPAGLGVVLISPQTRIERFEYLGHGTNNIAELTAILRAVEELGTAAGPVAIFTDSRYSIGVLQEGWKAKKNQQLIADVRQALAARDDIQIYYVKGHAGIPLNELADELARRAVDSRNSGRDELVVDTQSAAAIS